MRFGYHLPVGLHPEFIASLGDELLASDEFGWIELKYPHDIIGYDPAAYVSAVQSLAQRHNPGLSLHIPTHYDLGMWSVTVRNAVLEQIEATIEFGAQLGCTVMPIHPGTILHMDIPADDSSANARRVLSAAQKKKSRAFELTVSALKRLSDTAASHNVTLALENVVVPQGIAYSADDILELLTSIDRTNVRALFDCGHAHRRGYDVAHFVEQLGDQLCHVHVSDNDGTCDLHQQLGHGTIDFHRLFSSLKAIGYDGPVVVETLYESVEELKESARFLRDLL